MNIDHEYNDDGSQAWLGALLCIASGALVIWTFTRLVQWVLA